jgi:threonyl-tRNA synthetase
MLPIELNKLGAILLAKSMKDLYPNILSANYRVDENGFNYLFKMNQSFSLNDLPKVLKQMQKNIDRNYQITYFNTNKNDAINYFANNKFKKEMIDNENVDQINLIKFNDEYFDIAPNLNINKLSTIKAINLLNVSGEYWKGSSTNEQLISISGVCFFNQEELNAFVNEVNERKTRDHRKIGADLELFSFDMLAGQGLPI